MNHRLLFFILASLLIFLPLSTAAATDSSKFSAYTNQENNDELAAFFNGFMEEKRDELSIPGVAVVVVQNGEIVFSKGYGFSDIDNQTSVDPAKTVFRVGSVSKLVTATAVMQLVQQGKLDLHTDINEYLTTFKIPDTYSEPITMHHLLTHSAGFEDFFVGTATQNGDEFGSLETFLKNSVPERVTAPGEIHSYSNYSLTLAGYIVEIVSGVPFEEYADRNIFQPLGMSLSSFAQPLPAELHNQLATGYEKSSDELTPSKFEYDRFVPAAAMSTTAEDMAAFMIAHLQDDGSPILDTATTTLMHQQQFSHHAQLPGMTYGFKERFINGKRVIGHGGDIFAYASQMILIPEDNLGFFVAYNVFSDAFREDLIAEFFDQFYPDNSTRTFHATLELSQEDLARFAGTYRWVKYQESGIEKVIALLPQYNLIVQANEDGTLSVTFFGLEDNWKFAPIEPLVFKQIKGQPIEVDGLKIDPGDTLVFREDQNGNITYVFIALQNVAARRLAWYEGGEGTYAIMGTTSVVFLTIFVLMLVGAGINRLRSGARTIHQLNKVLWWAILAICGLNVVFITAMFLTFGEQLRFGIPPTYYILLSLPLVTVVLSVVLFGGMLWSWWQGYGSLFTRAGYVVVLINAGVFIWWVNYWNLLGYQF